jgi:hypothetical protein
VNRRCSISGFRQGPAIASFPDAENRRCLINDFSQQKHPASSASRIPDFETIRESTKRKQSEGSMPEAGERPFLLPQQKYPAVLRGVGEFGRATAPATRDLRCDGLHALNLSGEILSDYPCIFFKCFAASAPAFP